MPCAIEDDAWPRFCGASVLFSNALGGFIYLAGLTDSEKELNRADH